MTQSLLHRHKSADYVEKRKLDYKEAKRKHQRSKPISQRKQELREKLNK